ncbi:inositol polyphosphate-5-phosphatase A isoform X3 [Oryctolagus cuniculus]|uniref:inositol polyphosphate-5-phosphatase A isoform X3 n=1 Tax=Oryctolagus cuniculus TaxID=9986 RepID=UPI003879C066
MAGKAAAPGAAVLLVTANVGSLFDDPENLQKNWLREFYQVVHTHRPHFMALHCQEFGGKNYEASMSHVDKFVKELLSSDAMKEYNRARVYLDENYQSQEHFTALGSFYFLHESLKNIYQFDFKAKKYKKVTGKEIYSDTLESTPMLEKEKFPQDYFPECKWSRKGFIRTRWCLADCAFDLVNIHLFHDASNLVAWETSPSVYSGIRHKALGYVLDRIIDQRFEKVSYFVFGDFNFRLDSRSVVETLCTKATMQTVRAADTNEVVKLIFRESDNDRKVMLQLEKKLFDYVNQEVFRDNNGTALLEFDKELSVFKDRLCELDISFPPSRRVRTKWSPTTTSGPASAWETTSPCSWPFAWRPGQAGEASAAPGSRASARCSRLRHATCPPAAPHFASASGPFRKSLTYLTVVSVPVTLGRNTGFPSRPRSCCQN